MGHLYAGSVFFVIVASLISTGASATSDNLKVVGRLKPLPCEANFWGDGVVDHGVMMAWTLPRGRFLRLPQQHVYLMLACNIPTRLALKFVDGQPNSRVPGITGLTLVHNPEDYNYGLGTVAGKHVGGYVLTIAYDSSVDRMRLRPLWAVPGGPWAAGAVYLQNRGRLYTAGDGNNMPLAFREFTLSIGVQTWLNRPENLPLEQSVPLDGKTTIEMIYL